MAVVRYEKKWDEVDIINDGITFIPNLKDGILSWGNNAGLDNPEPIRLLDSGLFESKTKTGFPKKGESYAIYINDADESLYYWNVEHNRYDSVINGGVEIEITKGGETIDVFTKADIDAMYAKYYN